MSATDTSSGMAQAAVPLRFISMTSGLEYVRAYRFHFTWATTRTVSPNEWDSILRLQEDRTTPLFEGYRKQRRPTTSCQARAGVEHLFPKLANTRDLVLDNLGLSWVVLGGDEHAASRFYLEDLAVGLMRPVLNIDVDR